MRKKILSVSSIGGHWIQLLRIIRPLEEVFEIEYACTKKECAQMIGHHTFYHINDFNRKNIYKIIPALFKIIHIIKKSNPDVIITTGAAPGLAFILVAKLFSIKTIWIDSIANVEKLSGSGNIAKRIANKTYTQWPCLAEKNVFYKGNVFN